MAGSKKYRGKVCVYCRTNKSSTADHIFPREFFQIDKRADLPKVPACQKCNNEKSKLEHYLAAILPFGATHSDAKKELSIDVAKGSRKIKNYIRRLSKVSAIELFLPKKVAMNK